MSEFRKDGGGDFDKRGGAPPPSSGSGASGIDPFGFKHEVQAALRAEHRPSPEVMDLIQRWRIPEHVARAVQGKVSENLGQHLSFQELLTNLEWRDHHSVSRQRKRPVAHGFSLRAIVPLSLEDLPKRGYPLLQAHGRFQILSASSVEQWTVLAPMWPHQRHELRADGWNVVEFGTLDASSSQMLTDVIDAMERLEGITVSLGECSGVPNCPECGQGLEPLSFMHTPISIRWNGAKSQRTPAGCRLLSSLPRSGTQHIAYWRDTLFQSQPAWNSLEAVPDAEHHSGLLVDSSVYRHLPALVVNHAPHQQNGASALEYRLLPKRAHEVEVPACHGCRIVVPEHVRQVDTLVLEIPHHVLLRWLM